jgi:cell division septal protein FtsQ
MRTRAVLSPREGPADLGDLAEKSRLIRGQRVRRLRRRPRRAGRIGHRLIPLLAAVALLGAAAAGGRWLQTSPRFAVAEIEVRGQARVAAEALRAAAGIVPGEGLLRLDARAVAERLEAVPGIRRAHVIRRLPGRVTLLVEERRPFALAHAGGLRWVDEEGADLGPEARAVAVGAPVITGLEPGDLLPGDGRPPERISGGIALVRLLHRSGGGLLRQISEIDVSRVEGPVLYTVGGIEVRLGREEWESRLGRLGGVLAQLEASGEGVAAIDLRFRDQVVLDTAVR